MTRWAVVLVVATLMLAGCSGDDDGPDPDPDPRPDPSPRPTPTPRPTPPPAEVGLLLQFGMEGCSGLTLGQPVARETVAGLLPEGFEPAETPLPLVGLPSGTGVLVADIFHCATFSTPTTTLEDVWYGHLFTFIEPPTEVFPDRDLSADSHEYIFQMLAGEDVLSILWPAAGFPTYNGSADLQGPLPALWQASLGAYAWQSVIAPAPSDQGEFSFQRFTRLADGNHLVWTGNEVYPAGSIGSGTLDLAEDSPFAGHGVVQPGRLDGQSYLFEGASFTGMDLLLVRNPV